MSTLPKYWPQLEGKAEPEVATSVKLLYTGIQQHDQAITSLKQQLSDAVIAKTTVTAATSITESQVSGLVADLAAKAPVDSPTFTGTVTEPDAPVLTAATTTTSATTGAATALPAKPAGYLTISINGTLQKIPYFNV